MAIASPLWLTGILATAAAGAIGCQSTPAAPAPPRALASATAPPAASCDSDHVWDEPAHECRLYPGGGYAWAGCSTAVAPPNGEKCLTGSHWESCDCVCNRPSAYDAKSHACR